MNKNEIKKLLYIQKPIASFSHIENGIAYYYAYLDTVSAAIKFAIPFTDMGTAMFTHKMEGALLIRWIQEE